ncbi:MAG: wax ester/triacylglycerol synthase family O-acyltransferase, partial [Actinomycetota bacterium]|nr:wax ester/triacylglycerol synthase family O-acyltransferase [Actinomycetota bacterium]
MSLLDASFLYIENDVTPMHIGGVAIFEGPPPTHDELVSRFAAKLHLVPRYRQKVRFLPLNIGLPMWVDDPHFNIDYHLRRTAIPKPGGTGELRNFVGRQMAQHLDRARPLWEMWAVEGLEEGRWAIVSKVHHCMVDGVSSTDLMAVLFDADPTPPPFPDVAWQARPEPSVLDVLAQSVVGAISPIEQLRVVLPALRHPGEAVRLAMETLRSFASAGARLMPQRGESSLNGGFGPHRRWTSAHTSLADIKAIRAVLGGTVNDVVLSAITKGFRALLLSRSEDVEGRIVRTLVPVSVRAQSERGIYNNRVSAVFVDLPVGLDDPVARLTEIRRQMDGVKESKDAMAGERLVDLAGFGPPMLLAAGQRLASSLPQRSINTATTNVPGPQHPLYFSGRRLLESAPLVPLAGSIRVAIGIFSYDGGVHFGITGDYDTVADIDVLAHGIGDGIAELLQLAGGQSAAKPAVKPAAKSAAKPAVKAAVKKSAAKKS